MTLLLCRDMSTVAAETPQETVWNRRWQRWTGPSTVSVPLLVNREFGSHWRGDQICREPNKKDVSRISCVSSPGIAVASGLAATVTLTHLLKAGDGIVSMDDVYGGEG